MVQLYIEVGDFMFFRKRKHLKEYYLEKAKESSNIDIDIPYIEPESVKIVKDLDHRDDLYKVDSFFAYEDEEYLQILSGETEEDVMGIVMPKNLKLRKNIGSDGEVLETLTHGEEVHIKKAFNGWYYVETLNGVLGWCMCCHIDTSIGGYDKQEEAKTRNEYIEKTLEEAKKGLVKPDDKPTKIRKQIF